MKKTFLTAILIAASSSAFAGVKFKTTLMSEYVHSFGRVSIQANDDGKLTVTHDPNTCSPDGRICTEMAPATVTVEPTVIYDHRDRDGDLLLKLTDWLNLSVGSGYNQRNEVTYTVIEVTDLEKRIPLQVRANVTLTKK
jgi:hypothetical protein